MVNSTGTDQSKILVLLDFGKNSKSVLDTAFSLADKINGKLKVLHVKEPTKVVKQDNQFSAKRELYEDYQSTQKKLEALLNEMGRKVDYDLIYGNIKLSIVETIETFRPNITVLGKRKKRLGDRLSDMLIEKKLSSLLIVDSDKQAKDFDNVLKGVLMGGQKLELGPWKDLIEHNPDKIKYFSIEEGTQATVAEENLANRFVFSSGGNSLQNLVSYTDKVDTELFCIPHGVDYKFSKKLARKINTSVLVV